jgi:hypothetical protein
VDPFENSVFSAGIATSATEEFLIPMIVSNCALPLVIPSGKQAVFHTMDAQFLIRIRIRGKKLAILMSCFQMLTTLDRSPGGWGVCGYDG